MCTWIPLEQVGTSFMSTDPTNIDFDGPEEWTRNWYLSYPHLSPMSTQWLSWPSAAHWQLLLYKELVIKVLKEEEVSGIQLYPAGWPRKLQLTVKDEGLKEKILMEGLDIFGKHIEWQDENNVLTKVILWDSPVEFTEKNDM